MTATWPICFWGPPCIDFASLPGEPLYQKAQADDFGVPEADVTLVEASFRVDSVEASVRAEFVVASVRAESVVAFADSVGFPTVFVACESSEASGSISET